MKSNIGLKLPSLILISLGFLPFYVESKGNNWKSIASSLYASVFSVLRFSAYLIFVPSVILHDVFQTSDKMNLISRFYNSFHRFPWTIASMFLYGFLKLRPLSKLDGSYNRFMKKFSAELKSEQKSEWNFEIWAFALFIISNGYYVIQSAILYSEICSLSFKGIIYVWDLFGALTIFNWNCLLYYYSKQLTNVLQYFIDSFEIRHTHVKARKLTRKALENVNCWKKKKKKLLTVLKFGENINKHFNTPFSLLFAVDIYFLLFAVTGYVVSSKFDKKELAMILEPCIKVLFSMHMGDLIQVKVI